MKLPPTWSAAWAGLAPREKILAGAAAAVVLLALVWWIAVGPALAVLRNSDEQHRALDSQVAHMRALQQQAQALQSQPKQNHDESLRQLEASVRDRLGTTARMVVSGERVSLTLTSTPPEALASWLTQARVNARALPSEARLTRSATGAWDGTLALTLPPKRARPSPPAVRAPHPPGAHPGAGRLPARWWAWCWRCCCSFLRSGWPTGSVPPPTASCS